jgi:hypothetical protein
MPAPNLAQLQVDPLSLLVWLESNLLMAGTLQNVNNPNGLIWASIVPRGADAVGRPSLAVNSNGLPVDVYALRSDGTGVNDGLRSYICNYQERNVNSVDVGNLGDYCFTTNLNGCTYGIGPRQMNGNRRVTHSNRGGATGPQRADIQAENNVGKNLAGVTMLEPPEYRRIGGGGSLQATVIGIRSGTIWSYYFQSYTAIMQNQYRLNGVFPIRLLG